MKEQKKQKIAIVGAHCGRAAIEELVKAIDKDKLEAIIVDVDTKFGDGFIPRTEPLPIEPIKMIELPKYPETRAERRAKARKKKLR